MDLEPEQRGTTSAQFRLDVSVSPGNAHQFDLWRFGLSSLVDMELLDTEARASFAMSMTSWQFADVAISFGSSSAATFERSRQTIARTGLDAISLLVYLVDGSLEIDGRETVLKSGDILFFDLTRRFKIRVPDFQSLSLLMPRALLAPFVPNIDALHGLILPNLSPLNAIVMAHLKTLLAEAPALAAQDIRTVARASAALIGAVAGAGVNGHSGVVQNTSFSSLPALRRLVDANLANPELGPEFLCRQLGMSRATLYRLFEQLGGVRRYIQQRRLMGAYQRLTDPVNASDRIGNIAARYGFGNDSAFSRAFRETYSMSPTDLREASREGKTAHLSHGKDSAFITMNRWLLGLDIAGR
ncbi:helix-turn-helix domain-containing protein [Hyphomicrobium sp. LHD-15]|uniref:helix-turn-helix domain-containing protein n=1 Tax=Hyphomicrobium sp. LHD-15 TaxID=3072142 RepID=UPI002810985A|nr:helix-turn-helix domain-containing protein [Hyphomicrobium sp. LHD-15]MDQ8697098.1 helix-turn-helix domain-containing protein [Hyphomicrobium sp. LHD-15]